MSRSLGTLTLDIIAKTGGFVQGMDKAERASAKWRKQVNKDLDEIKKKGTIALGAVAAATVALAVTQTRAASELRQQAQLANSTAEEFQRLAVAGGVVGLSQEKISDQLKDFNEKLGEFQQSGGGGMKDFFEQIAPQIDITAESFKNLSGPQALQLYYDSLEKAGLSQQQMSFYLESMASDSTALIPLLRNGGEAMNFFADEAERAGAIMDQQTIDAAERLGAAAWVAQQGLQGLKNDISAELLPTLADLAGAFSSVTDDGIVAESVASAISGTLKTLTATAVGAVAAIKLLGQSVGGAAAVADASTGDRAWYEMINLATAARTVYENWGQAKDTLDVVKEDLNETALSFAETIRAIWDAGDGDSDGSNLIDRVAEFRKALQVARDEAGNIAGGAGAGGSAAAKALMAQLEQQRILLEEGEEAAYRYSLGLKGIVGAEADAAVAAKKHNDELQAAIDERDEFTKAMSKWADEQRGAMEAAAQAEADYAKSLSALLDPMSAFEDEAKKIQEIFEKGLLGDATQSEIDAYIEKLREAAKEAAGISESFDFAALESGLGGAVNSLAQIEDTMAEGSKEARVLSDVMKALSVAQGAAAIANAMATGDPYTAVARALAVAATLASAGIELGVTGSDSTAAADAQAAQGTGGVLGDSAAKSESILKASEISATALERIVGINTGMARGIDAMVRGISGASGQIMRGQDFSSSSDQWGLFRSEMSGALGDSFDFITSMDGLTGWIDDMLGGSRAVINSGIEIAGGMITDLIDNTVVSAFEEVEEKKHFLDDKDVRRFEEALGDNVSSQFQAVFAGMVDAVSEAADALGLDDVQARIDAFRVQTTEISLMDLTGEEQEAELTAVFSDIFDGLATAVVPFIDDFRQSGEGMAETLIRVATQVQVTEEAISQLGISFGQGLDPQQFAEASDELIRLGGGLEQFIGNMQAFVSAFATDEHKLTLATDSISRAFDQLALGAVPQTDEALWELMGTLTDPEQINGLLNLTDAFKEYFSALEAIERERTGLTLQLLRAQGDAEGALTLERELALDGMHESNRALQQQIWALNDLAAAAEAAAQAEENLANLHRGVADQLLNILSPAHAELESISRSQADQIRRLTEAEGDLTNVRHLHQLQLLEFASSLEDSITDLSEQLFGTVDDGMRDTVRAVDNRMNDIRASMLSALEGVNDWLQSSLLSSVSPLTPEDRLAEAQSQFNSQLTSALGGNASAIADLPALADQLLSEASGFFGGSTQEFDQIWMQVRDAMQQVSGIDVPEERPTYQQQESIVSATESTALSAYEQLSLSADLVGQIAALARVTGESPSDIADRLGVPMGELIDTLGFVPDDISLALDDQFDSLVSGFDAKLDPLLSVQQAQLDITTKMAENIDLRLERLEQIMERGVNYEAVIATSSTIQAASAEQLVAAERRKNATSPQRRIE